VILAIFKKNLYLIIDSQKASLLEGHDVVVNRLLRRVISYVDVILVFDVMLRNCHFLSVRNFVIS